MPQLKYNLPSPIEKVLGHHLRIDLYVKREDLIHPLIKGNKYRKLKYNLSAMSAAETIITFGGAYSNHVHALAAMCADIGKQSVGIIRGERVDNKILRFCQSCGMQLHFVSREDYRYKENTPSIKAIIDAYPDAVVIPEGGSNKQALIGVKEVIMEIAHSAMTFDYIAVAAGTGCTAAGLLLGIEEYNLDSRLLVFSALRGEWMKETIKNFANSDAIDFFCTDAYSLGGYAKSNTEYEQFVDQFIADTYIPVDKIYNGKLLYGLADMVHNGHINADDKILWINSGGVIN